jgi:hypothetical protein
MESDESRVQYLCSTACMRAGLTALVFAALAVSLLPVYQKAGGFRSLGEYVVQRIRLEIAVQRLEADPCWLQLVTSTTGEPPSHWSVKKLGSVQCGAGTEPNSTDSPQKTGPQSPPMRPTGLRIPTPLEPAVELVAALTPLLDERTTDRAREVSNRVNVSIYRWQALRSDLIAKAMVRRAPGTIVITGGARVSGDTRIVTQAEIDQLLDLLDLRDVKTLVATEAMTFEQYDAMLADLKRLDLPGVASGVGYITATHVTEATLALSILWFLLNYREAQQAPGFPSPGTLFALFRRSRSTRILFHGLLCAPPIGALLLAKATAQIADDLGWLRYADWGMAALCVIAAFRIALTVRWFREATR